MLIFGHSFVRRLNDDLCSVFDKRARINFHMASSGDVSLKGIGGRTAVDKVFTHDICCVLCDISIYSILLYNIYFYTHGMHAN